MITMNKPLDESNPVNIGEVLPNGGIVIAFHWRHATKGEAEGKHGYVLCLLPGNLHPFVVWRFVKEPVKNILCINGDYWANLDGALMMFKAKVRKL